MSTVKKNTNNKQISEVWTRKTFYQMKRSFVKTKFGPRLQFAISYKHVLRVLQRTDKYWNYTSCRNVEQGETKCKCYRFCFTVVNLTFTLSSMKFILHLNRWLFGILKIAVTPKKNILLLLLEYCCFSIICRHRFPSSSAHRLGIIWFRQKVTVNTSQKFKGVHF